MSQTPIVTQYNLDQNNNNNFFTINTIQGDGQEARFVELYLTANGYPYTVEDGDSVIVKGTKPDGTTIVNDCRVLQPDMIQFEITSQMAAVPGTGIYNISVISRLDGSVVSSFPFHIVVTPDTQDPEGPSSSDEYQGIANLQDEIETQIGQTLEYEVVGTF